jgi:hypothetical protein
MTSQQAILEILHFGAETGCAKVTTNITKSMIDAGQGDWSLQGFGMLRLYLTREIRLHVWDSRFSWDTTTLHTHPWDFTSVVLSGAITDRVMGEADETDPRLADLAQPYFKQQIVCGPGGGESGKPFPIGLWLLKEKVYHKGDSYQREAHQIHESIAKPGTVTLVERKFLKDTEHANVFYPTGQVWKSAEPRPASVGEVKSVCQLALSRWAEL